jgi:NADH-quinone oxidoreductase subunit L
VTSALEHFLDPTFADSRLDLSPSNGLVVVGLVLGAVLAIGGIGIAYFVWVARPGTSERIRERFSFLHRLFVNKWYFDELIDLVVVRPAAWAGRFGQQTFERVVINGLFVGGTTGIVKAGSAAARALQSGFLRAYAAMLVLGIVAVAFYFLIQSS